MATSPYKRETTENLLQFLKVFIGWANSGDARQCACCGKDKTDPSHKAGEGCVLMNAINMVQETESEGKSTPLRDDMLKFSKALEEWAYLVKDGQSELDRATRDTMRPMLRGLLKSLDQNTDTEPAPAVQ